jgi:hypothetical protein
MFLKCSISLVMAISSLIGLLIAGVPLTTIPQWMAHGVHSYPRWRYLFHLCRRL